MTAVEILQRTHSHRAWVTRNLLDAAAGLSDGQLRATFPIGQGSVWKSLLHLYAAEYGWLEAALGDDAFVVPGDRPGKLTGNQEAEGGIATLAELREKWATLERRWADHLALLTPESLDEVVYKTSVMLAPGQRWETRRSDVLLHVCLHAHYTAAQVVNMLRQNGVTDLPPAMLTVMARQESVV